MNLLGRPMDVPPSLPGSFLFHLRPNPSSATSIFSDSLPRVPTYPIFYYFGFPTTLNSSNPFLTHPCLSQHTHPSSNTLLYLLIPFLLPIIFFLLQGTFHLSLLSLSVRLKPFSLIFPLFLPKFSVLPFS